MKTLDDGRDFRAVDTYIGKRAVVERRQLAIGALAAAPRGERIARREEEIDQHGSAPDHIVHCKNRYSQMHNHRKERIPAMHRVPEPINFVARFYRIATCVARQNGCGRSERMRQIVGVFG